MNIDWNKLLIRSRKLIAHFGCLWIAGSIAVAPVAKSDEGRLFEVDDLFRLETMAYSGGAENFAFSTDGNSLAFVRQRPIGDGEGETTFAYLNGNHRGDVWVRKRLNSKPVKITDGSANATGWFAPIWSPGGTKLAMLSSKSDGSVNVWVWEAQSGHLKQVGQRNFGFSGYDPAYIRWLDEERLIYPATSIGALSSKVAVMTDTPRIATDGWRKAALGRDVTASVLRSGDPRGGQPQKVEALMLVDTVSGSERELISRESLNGRDAKETISADGKYIAFLKPSAETAKLEKDKPIPLYYRMSLSVADIDARRLVDSSSDFSDAVIQSSLAWAPDKPELAFLAEAGETKPGNKLHLFDADTGSLSTRHLPTLNALLRWRTGAQTPALQWTGSDEVIVYAAKQSEIDDALSDTIVRYDWWRIPTSGDPVPLTNDLEASPSRLWPEPGRRTFVGVAGGELWRVFTDGTAPEKLSERVESPVGAIVWPMASMQLYQGQTTYEQVIVSGRDQYGNSSYYRADLKGDTVSEVESPATGAKLESYSPKSHNVVFTHNEDTHGLRFWTSNILSGHARLIVEANTFLKEIDWGTTRRFEYTSLNGENLEAWLLLPPGYKEGRRYPIITGVYAGRVYRGSKKPPLFFSTRTGYVNYQIAAARGYAILLPSMPLQTTRGNGVKEDPLLRLTEGVLPAIENVIEMGFADPDRIYLLGYSYGGFSSYGLVSQTNRFTAAVSAAGMSNFVSTYGQYDGRRRYQDVTGVTGGMVHAEFGQFQLGGPPWSDLGRYIRNSPITYVDRVETPLMIVYGDLDYVPIQQGEEFFTSLYRQGKRAEFVRYWGEGHAIRSPANIRDYWERVFNWFEQFPEEDPDTTTD